MPDLDIATPVCFFIFRAQLVQTGLRELHAQLSHSLQLLVKKPQPASFLDPGDILQLLLSCRLAFHFVGNLAVVQPRQVVAEIAVDTDILKLHQRFIRAGTAQKIGNLIGRFQIHDERRAAGDHLGRQIKFMHQLLNEQRVSFVVGYNFEMVIGLLRGID